MELRPCKICGATPDKARFYASITSRCADCHKKCVAQYRAENLAEVRQRDRERYIREWAKRRAWQEAYRKTERGKEAVRRGSRAYHERHPERRAARIALWNALRGGVVAKATACQGCGAAGRLHGHHDDYAKPLEVRWLCVPCHEEAHHEVSRITRPLMKAAQP